ncbi:MAG: helix-turn-helix domain-containing protein [Bacteroidia bacterium]|nr:helix-turn-helix domain-containing protein [Bacteroidia bacterium]
MNQCIAERLGISRNTVSHWRRVWARAYEGLCVWEAQQVSDGALLAKMRFILKDAPRGGAPVRISQAEKESLLALACKKPKDFELPLTRWTSESLAQVAQQEGIVKKISPRYVREILKKK